MKKTFILFFLLGASPLFAQITLEHQYGDTYYRNIAWEQVDSNEVKFIFSRAASIDIYNCDHTLYKSIPYPRGMDSNSVSSNFTRHLFNNDDKIEFLTHGKTGVYVYNEDGDSLFYADSCVVFFNFDKPRSDNVIINTEHGTKMALLKQLGNGNNLTLVYSLPGKLPTCTTKLGVTDAPSIISSGSSFPTSAYPNPTNGKVRIEYKLPVGVTSGEIVITTNGGIEVKRYRVGETFNDILIERTDLASGSYFYRLVTEKGESDAKRLVVTR